MTYKPEAIRDFLFSLPFQTNNGDHPAFCAMGTEAVSRGVK
jgi:hypothetical protein